MLKRLPNILSCCRIVLSLPLPFITEQPILFIIVYLLCGVTDIADGYVARRYDAYTEIGAKLDSIGDFVFFGVSIIVAFTLVTRESFAAFAAIVAGISIVRSVNLVVTKVKFHQWGVIHTTGNKCTGIALFAALPICAIIGHIPITAILVVGALAAFSALEEMAILLTLAAYDSNQKSIFAIKNK